MRAGDTSTIPFKYCAGLHNGGHCFNHNLPGLIGHLGLLMAVPCTLLTPGPWAGREICEWSNHLNTLSLLCPLHDHYVEILHNTTQYYIFQYYKILCRYYVILHIGNTYLSNATQYCLNTALEYYKILHITTSKNTTKYYTILRQYYVILHIGNTTRANTTQYYWNTTIILRPILRNSTYYYMFQYYTILSQYYLILHKYYINTTSILRESNLGQYYMILH